MKNNHHRFLECAFRVLNGFLMLFIVFITLYPFIHILALSFSSEGNIVSGKVGLIPLGFNTDAIKRIFGHPLFGRSYLNTIYYTVLFIFTSLTLTTLLAYPISKTEMPGSRLFKKMIMFTMFFSGGMIPNFLLVKSLGLYDTVWAVVLPGAVGAWNVMVMMSYFQSIPEALEEAAFIDGLGYFGSFCRIVLPLSKPIIATMVLFFAVAQWNSWFGPLIYFGDSAKYPVMLVVRNILFSAQQMISDGKNDIQLAEDMQNTGAEGIKYAAILFTALPFLVIYPFAQKYFVQGMMIGSVKG